MPDKMNAETDDFEDTSVGAAPAPPRAPAQRAQTQGKQPSSSARQALNGINELKEQLAEHTRNDSDNLQAVNSTLLKLTEKVGETQTGLATVTSTVQTMKDALELRDEQEARIREDERMRARAAFELEQAQKLAAVEVGTSNKKTRNEILVKALAWMGPVFVAVGGAIVAALHRCGGG